MNRSAMQICVLSAMVLIMGSCDRSNTTTPSANSFNIDSILQEQILYLSTSKAAIHKQADINDVYQDTTFMPIDSAAWARELDIFAEIGRINKPTNKGSYTVVDNLNDPSSNLTMRTLSTTQTLPIVYLKAFYLDTPDKLRKIEALYKQENALLTSKRKLVMEFTDTYNKSILTSYSVEGVQKMFIGDSVHFTITCTVHLN